MREILFRGRNEMFGWIYGFYVYTGGLRHIITDLSGISYRVGSKTVGQFTGLLDKNGKKIFEGDIVKADWGKTPMTIIWNESDFWWEASVTPEYNGWCLDDLNPCEVIGNIHENPELLEVSP